MTVATVLSLSIIALLTAPTSSLVVSPTSSYIFSRRHARRSSYDTQLTVADGAAEAESQALPPELAPVTRGVFSQMLGEGIAYSSLPLYLTGLGATPLTVGLAISCFSIAQMTFAPVLVGLSSRVGRSRVLRICLAGAAASSLLIALSGSVYGVVAGRALAGVFAACVPVAQSAVTDILPVRQSALGLSRVSAASQLGVVVGPAASALLQAAFASLGLPAARCLPAVFMLSAAFSLGVLAQVISPHLPIHLPTSTSPRISSYIYLHISPLHDAAVSHRRPRPDGSRRPKERGARHRRPSGRPRAERGAVPSGRPRAPNRQRAAGPRS